MCKSIFEWTAGFTTYSTSVRRLSLICETFVRFDTASGPRSSSGPEPPGFPSRMTTYVRLSRSTSTTTSWRSARRRPHADSAAGSAMKTNVVTLNRPVATADQENHATGRIPMAMKIHPAARRVRATSGRNRWTAMRNGS